MRRSTLVRLAALLLVGVALVTFPQWSREWGSSRYVTTVLADILIFAMFAMSLNLLVGYAGMPSLGHAAFYGGGAYAAGIVARRLETTDLFVMLAAAVGVAALLALVIGFFAVRAVGIFFLMLTLAFAQIVFAYVFKATDVTGGSNGLAGVARPEAFGMSFSRVDDLYGLTVVAFVLMALLIWRVVTSPYGRALVGVRENERRMRALGYDTRTLKLSVFVLAGALAGIAGAFAAWDARYVSPGDAGLGTSIVALLMVLIGGAGTLAGPLAGAAAVFLIERVLPSYLRIGEHDVSQALLGVIFIAFVIGARQGIVGLGQQLFARWSARA